MLFELFFGVFPEGEVDGGTGLGVGEGIFGLDNILDRFLGSRSHLNIILI